MRISIRNTNFLLAIILLLAAALRLYKCDFQNLWLDEVLTMNSANPDLTLQQFYDSVMYWEFIPHLFFFLNRILFEIFGYSSLVARIFSAIIGVFGVYGIYLLGKELFNKRAGLIAALLLAVNIYHISYSQEIRPYGLLFLFSVLSFYRFVIFIKKASVKNAVHYGIFTGLIVNAHFFGVITIFSQSLILLYFLSIRPKEGRMTFFKDMLIAAGVALLLALPVTQPFIRVSEIKSFWMPKPEGDVYTILFKDFFGNAEMLLYCIQVIILYYGISLFRQKLKRYDNASVLGNKLIFSFIILSLWLFISIALPLIKSHLSASMMVSRYFISVLGTLILIIAIGLALIKNKPVLTLALSCLVCFSLIDLFVVKNYYNEIAKTQYREFAAALKKENPDQATIVTFYGWILPYYFQDEPGTQIESNTLENYLAAMKSGAMPQTAFWYADFNQREYELSGESQVYLDDNFVLVKELKFYDIWGNYYVPKSVKERGHTKDSSKYIFKGIKTFLENGTYKSKEMNLTKGAYQLIIDGISTPEIPVKGENAHLLIKYGGKKIGEVYLSEKKGQEQIVAFKCLSDAKGMIEFIYDNDVYVENKDRNATLYSIKISKIE